MYKTRKLINSCFYVILLLTIGCNLPSSQNSENSIKSAKEIPPPPSSGSSCEDCGENSIHNFANDQLIDDQSASVGLIYEPGNAGITFDYQNTTYQRVCSGTLINNEADKLYFLTAAHCFLNDLSPTDQTKWENNTLTNSEMTSLINTFNSNISDWIIRFDHECTTGSQTKQSFVVADLTFLSGSMATDFALLEIEDYLTEENKDKLRLSGWTRNTTSTAVFDVHHPLGRTKRVAKSSSGFVTSSTSHVAQPKNSNFRNNFWYVELNENYAGNGVGQGSSGSGLINNQGYLVGMLHGHFGYYNSDSCSLYDKVVFSKFSKAWDEQNPYDKQRTLKEWLAPSGNNLQSMDSHSFTENFTIPSNYVITQLGAPCNTTPEPTLNCGYIELSWDKGINVTYKIYRNGSLISTISNSNTESFIDQYVRSWAGNTTFSYTLKAYDSSGNQVFSQTKNTTGGFIAN